MSHITVDIPESKPMLDASLARQFTSIQRQLMGLVKFQQQASQTMRSDFLTTLRRQQEGLTDALEQLLKVMPKPMGQVPDHSDALVQAIRELRQVMRERPKLMRNGNGHNLMRPSVTVNPKVTVQLPAALTNRLDGLESALLGGMRRFRSRTFGSNY